MGHFMLFKTQKWGAVRPPPANRSCNISFIRVMSSSSYGKAPGEKKLLSPSFELGTPASQVFIHFFLDHRGKLVYVSRSRKWRENRYWGNKSDKLSESVRHDRKTEPPKPLYYQWHAVRRLASKCYMLYNLTNPQFEIIM